MRKNCPVSKIFLKKFKKVRDKIASYPYMYVKEGKEGIMEKMTSARNYTWLMTKSSLVFCVLAPLVRYLVSVLFDTSDGFVQIRDTFLIFFVLAVVMGVSTLVLNASISWLRLGCLSCIIGLQTRERDPERR